MRYVTHVKLTRGGEQYPVERKVQGTKIAAKREDEEVKKLEEEEA
jgi:hypothetical protein